MSREVHVRFCESRGVRFPPATHPLLGFIGPKSEAEEIKQRLAEFLRDDLKLELSPEKTLITHARKGAASFLGYEITVQHNDRQVTRGRRTANGAIALRVPAKVIREKATPYLSRGKPAHRSQLLNEEDYTIVNIYGTEYRGIVQYYLLAGNVCRLHRLRWVMETSLLKTLAAKHRSTVSKMAARYKAKVETPHGPRTCFEASVPRSAGRKPLVARFGGISLTRQKAAVLIDHQVTNPRPRKELLVRLLRGKCELCGTSEDVRVHHIRKLADLDMEGSPTEWRQVMARKRRKTLVVCTVCHDKIHSGQPTYSVTE